MNLYDLTQGNYRVHRTVSYADFPESELIFDTQVRQAGGAEWATTITISGSYDGPTDVVAVEDYRITWTANGKTLDEKGSATLKLSSGKTLRTTWVSSIVPDEPRFDRFPAGGETVSATFSPFRLDGNKMSYDWSGTVQAATKAAP